MKVVLRFVASVLATSGALLIADAAMTLAWQEPVSAWLAGREQQALQRQLDGLERRWRPQAGAAVQRASTRRAAAAFRRAARTGQALGRIELPTLGRRYVMVQGTDRLTLRKGPGHYPETPMPGEGGTVAVAGHRTTYLAPFPTIDELDRGDRVVLRMPYGRFTYRVEGTRIVDPTARRVIRRVGYERLVLTACHPLYSAAQRIVVFGRLVESSPRP
jgi:sortase A